MESLFHYVSAPGPCGYLPQQRWSLEYNIVAQMTPAEYLQRLLENWRRFGNMIFRPVCEACRACRSLRVVVPHFRPDRSQRRCRQLNEDEVELRIGEPSVNRTKLALYDRYHAFQSDRKGWPHHAPRDSANYTESFVHHPFPVEEWCYYVKDQLIGVGYVDVLPGEKSEIRNPKSERNSKDPKKENPKPTDQDVSDLDDSDLGFPSDFGFRISDLSGEGGLSAIYFFYDPRQRHRSPGTWNVLCLIEEAARRGLPYLYLGYYVAGCASMSYKPRFVPNQLRGDDGVWRDFRI
jgi:arginine-tRNA-protein transferase